MPSKNFSQDITNLTYRSTDELQSAIHVEKLKNTTLGYNRVLQSGDRLYDRASLSYRDGDEESAYVLYMRAIEIYQNAKKCKDYRDQRDKKHWVSMCGHKVKDALAKCESIFTSLEKKYSILKEIDDAQKKEKAELEELQDNQRKFGQLKEDLDIPKTVNLSASSVITEDFKAQENYISCEKLYTSIISGHESYLILDIRPENEFNDSHIKSDYCLNISEDLFISGVTASKIESQLKSVNDRMLFRKRHEADYVILVDWQSSVEDIKGKGKSLRILFNALYQFDNVQLKRAPVVLEGGYKSFLLCYPTLTTNGKFKRRETAGADCATEGNSSKSSSEYYYPDLSSLSAAAAQQQRSRVATQPVQQIVESKPPYVRLFQRPDVPDRSLKPKTFPTVSVPLNEPKRSVSPINSGLDAEYHQAITVSKQDDLKSQLDGLKQKISDASRTASEIGGVRDEKSTIEVSISSETTEQEREMLVEKQRGAELILEAKTEKIDQVAQQLEQLRALKPKIPTISHSTNIVDNNNENIEKLERDLKILTLERDDIMKQNAELTAELARRNEVDRLRKERKLNEKTKKPTRPPEVVVPSDGDVKLNDVPSNSTERSDNVAVDEGNEQSSGRNASSPDDSSGSLRRAQSSPNIAKIVAQEQTAALPASNKPLVDRVNKPSGNNSDELLRREGDFFAKSLNSLRTVYGNVRPGLTGLRNLGCTCYMNSTIQCLSNTESLRDYFITQRYRRDINYYNKLGFSGVVARNFAVLLQSLWTGTNKVVIPYEFKRVAGLLKSEFDNYLQQDAQEFANYLLDGLHEDLNRVKIREPIDELNSINVDLRLAADRAWQNYLKLNNSIIVDLFQGQFMNVIECQTCKTHSCVFDPVLFLTLPLPSEHEATKCSLERCLNGLLEAEFMTGDSKWACPKCKCKRDAKKWFQIWKLPKVLIICLNRFQGYGKWHQKLRTMVEFPVNSTLNLENHIAGSQSCTTFRLYGVVNHYGTMEAGHYTAYCRNGGTWFEFDDDKVAEISDRNIASPSAYLLFYMAC